jgi:hypothetical protein
MNLLKTPFVRYLLYILAVLGLLVVGWVWLSLQWSYATGDRAGYVQKFSNKGWVCKTWEGEIAMVTMPGAIPEKFEFTVRDEQVAQQINALAGKRVVLHYKQHKFVPTSCFGETEYFVDEVREVIDAPAALANPATTGQLSTPK